MMIDTGEGRLILVDDQYFDAQIYPNRPVVLVQFRIGWMEWMTLGEGSHYHVFDNDAAGEDALLACAIANGYSLEPGQLKMHKALDSTR